MVSRLGLNSTSFDRYESDLSNDTTLGPNVPLFVELRSHTQNFAQDGVSREVLGSKINFPIFISKRDKKRLPNFSYLSNEVYRCSVAIGNREKRGALRTELAKFLGRADLSWCRNSYF